MQIINTLDNTPGLGSDNDSDTVGIVMKTSEELGFPGLGVFIPKFMLGYSLKSGEKATEKSISISNSKCVNDKSIGSVIDKSLILKNFIIVRPLLNQNQFMPEYVVGDKVIIKVIDNDLKTLMFYPYSINRLGQRATDKLLLVVPANKSENTALSEDNTYFIKVDSTNKNIEITANNVNGETCKQTILMNPSEGTITVTDNKNLTWTMDTKNDTIKSQTSGSSIEMASDVITIKADTVNIQTESEVNIKTDTLNNEASTIKSKGDDVTLEYNNFKQKTDSGEWDVRDEVHSVTSVSYKDGSTFFVDIPTIGLNGQVVFPNFVIGSISNINAPVPPTNGDSGSKGSMLLKTSVAAMPLAKFQALSTALIQIGSAADIYPSGAGSGSAAASVFAASGMTTKIMGE